MALPTLYKIHPAIGVARIGNSPSAFFIGPEVPGRPPEGDATVGSTVPPFKDGGKIKRQGARFRVWRYDDDGKGKYKPVEEKTLDSKDVEWIRWTVHLANKKAAFFQFNGLLGDVVYGPSGVTPKRRNASVTHPKHLWIDPGERRIKGRNKKVEILKGNAPVGQTERWPLTPPTPAIDRLGEVRTDGAGRLIVLGGLGVIGSVPGAAAIGSYANNDGWYDDVSDGPVNATIKIKGISRPIPAVGAWCLCGPPSFSPFARNVVSLWDTLFDLAAREMTLPTNDVKYDGVLSSLRDVNKELKGKAWGHVTLSTYVPVFETDIWPILRAGLDAGYLFDPAQFMHSSLGAYAMAATYKVLASPAAADQAARKGVFDRLHQPGVTGDGLPDHDMPKQLGDDPYPVGSGGWGKTKRLRLTVTPTQYAMLERWKDGKFTSTTTSPPPIPPATITPEGLDRAALEACVGGPFFPGIECSWQIRHPKLYAEPFRIDQRAKTQYLADTGRVSPGHFSRQMALPWAADFLMCRTENHGGADWAWWPVPRPHDVYPKEADAKARASMLRWARSTSGAGVVNWASGGPEPVYPEMFASWTLFGFVIRKGDVLFETERPANVP
jgi:L-Lysine epsilon oxidase N-terminal/L-lysine epsilon oxidase C-terminal domain